MNVPGEKPLGAPWDVNDMISYSASDPLADYSERFDITTRARIAQINNLEKAHRRGEKLFVSYTLI